MYKVELKTVTPRDKSIKPEVLSEYQQCITALNNTPEGGFDNAEMRKRNKVYDALDSVKTEFNAKGEAEVFLEDADFETLKSCLEKCKWAINEPCLVDFYDYIHELKRHQIKPLKGEVKK